MGLASGGPGAGCADPRPGGTRRGLGYAAHKRGLGIGLGILPVAALGLVVARRQPANPIGWLLTGFGAELVCYDAVDLGAVRAELAAAVDRSVEPAHVWVWIRQPG